MSDGFVFLFSVRPTLLLVCVICLLLCHVVWLAVFGYVYVVRIINLACVWLCFSDVFRVLNGTVCCCLYTFNVLQDVVSYIYIRMHIYLSTCMQCACFCLRFFAVLVCLPICFIGSDYSYLNICLFVGVFVLIGVMCYVCCCLFRVRVFFVCVVCLLVFLCTGCFVMM